MPGRPPIRNSWAAASSGPVARRLVRPLRDFLRTESAGGIVLLVATLVALIWANSPLSDSYESLWHTEFEIGMGDARLAMDLREWVNDGLMTVFFFIVGLEIKREFIAGELRSPRRAALPVIAALGGMLVPAAIYAAFNAGGDGSTGWGIAMATDIAFAVGVLSLLGPRCPTGLKVFLLTLAIADDIGAIVVIAIFYSEGLALGWLAAAALLFVAVWTLRRIRVWYTPIYAVLGVVAWLAMLESGVHATVAGVALGLLTPAVPLDPGGIKDALEEAQRFAEEPSPVEIRRMKLQAQETISVAERVIHAMHPWTSYVIVPLFALANAGVEFGIGAVGDALTSPVAAGVVLGLVVGKLVGITSFALGATWLGLGQLPDGVDARRLAGAAGVAGIGFTVSLFIASLAFTDGGLVDEAKVGILVGSVLATLVGAAILRTAPPLELVDEDAAEAMME